MPEGPDPLGKRALFRSPVEEEAKSGADPPAAAGRRVERRRTVARRHVRPSGKRALYSSVAPVEGTVEATAGPAARSPSLTRGLLSVACSSCGAVTRVGLVAFATLHFPFGVWFPVPVALFRPGRQFDRRMTCPACRRRTWASVTCAR